MKSYKPSKSSSSGDIVQSIIDFKSRIEFISHLDYLEWAIEKFGALLPEGTGLVLGNIHYISPLLQTDSTGGSLYGIPSITDREKIPDHYFFHQLAGTMAFLGGCRILEMPSSSATRNTIEQFQSKFIVEIIRENSATGQSLPPEFDSHANILTSYLAEFYQKKSPGAYFLDEIQQNDGFVKKEVGNGRVLLDGIAFENALNRLLYSPGNTGFFGEIQQFLLRPDVQQYKQFAVNHHIDMLTAAGLPIDPKFIELFIGTSILHSWLKQSQFTYMIPRIFAGVPHLPPSLAILLLNTNQRLTLDQLNRFHLLMGSVVETLFRIDLRETGQADVIDSLDKNAHNIAGKTGSQDIEPETQQSQLFMGMVGNSPRMQQLFQKIKTVARHDVDVLIIGESGAGKEGVAKAIHELSERKNAPFITISLADRPDSLIESELFGHEKGAFTNAGHLRIGCFEAAQGGTLFLDEISHISPAIQAKLLRVLQNREIQRIGSNEKIPVNLRIISATSENLLNDHLREKLGVLDPFYYRLQQYIITVPRLSERKSDIPLLAEYFIKHLNNAHSKQVRIHPQTLQSLINYDWPGNVRELQNLSKRAFINAYDDGEIRTEHFELDIFAGTDQPLDGLDERARLVLKYLRLSHFNIEKALKLMIAENAFHPSRKTFIRYSRELSLWFLVHKNWDLPMAIKAFAGDEALVKDAAKKYRDYLIGDKSQNGLLTFLQQNQIATILGLFRKTHHPLVMQLIGYFSEKNQAVGLWKKTLDRYL